MSEPYTCPSCQSPVSDEDALLCHYCGESLGRPSKGALGQIRYGGPKVVGIGLGLLALAVMVILGMLL